MLESPQVGFARSVEQHNVRLDYLCDWIEASVLFSTGSLSQIAVADMLVEASIYARKEMATQRIEDAWVMLRSRHRLLGQASPFVFENLTLRLAKGTWKDYPAYSFCILLSITEFYPKWSRSFGPDYTDQGMLFESLTEESLTQLFPGWEVHSTGWSRERPTELSKVVKQVCAILNETPGTIERWTKPKAKEAGLDLLCYLPHNDRRGNYPALLFQCASGADWEDKLKTPDMEVWRRIVEFRARSLACRAFSTPFCIKDDCFDDICNRIDGFLLDRYRILAAGIAPKKWPSSKLSSRLKKWISPRVKSLPKCA